MFFKQIEKYISENSEKDITQIKEIRMCETNKHHDPVYSLNLPDIVKDDISAGDYIYYDYTFHLNHDELMGILMGQELYGEPVLCLRELIQNSFDALQLRELHTLLPDADLIKPVDYLRNGETLHIKVSWGKEGNREYIIINRR